MGTSTRVRARGSEEKNVAQEYPEKKMEGRRAKM